MPGVKYNSPLWNIISVIIGGLLVLISNIGLAIYQKQNIRENLYTAILAQTSAVLEINKSLNTGNKLREIANQIDQQYHGYVTLWRRNGTCKKRFILATGKYRNR